VGVFSPILIWGYTPRDQKERKNKGKRKLERLGGEYREKAKKNGGV